MRALIEFARTGGAGLSDEGDLEGKQADKIH